MTCTQEFDRKNSYSLVECHGGLLAALQAMHLAMHEHPGPLDSCIAGANALMQAFAHSAVRPAVPKAIALGEAKSALAVTQCTHAKYTTSSYRTCTYVHTGCATFICQMTDLPD